MSRYKHPIKLAFIWFMLGLSVFVQVLPAHSQTRANYCAQCHLLAETHTLGQMAWRQPLKLELETPCPGVRRAKTRMALFEARLINVAHSLKCEAPGWGGCDSLRNSMDKLDLFYAKSQGRRLRSLPQLDEIMDELDGRLSVTVMMPLIEYERDRAAWAFWLILGWLATVLLVAWIYRQKTGFGKRL